MAFSVFEDKNIEPNERDLKKALGTSYMYWDEVVQYVDKSYGHSEAVWRFTGQRYGWNMRIVRKKRNIVYFTPKPGFFINGFVFGDRAVRAAEQRGLPSSIINIIHEAPKYAEGTGFRIEVHDQSTVLHIKKLIDIKIAN